MHSTKSCPSEQPLRVLIDSITKALGLQGDPSVLIDNVLYLRTPHLKCLLGGRQASGLWLITKHERNHRKKGMAISQPKGIIYIMAVLDALGVFVAVDEQFYEKLEVTLVVQQSPEREMIDEDFERLHGTCHTFDSRAQPWIAATLSVWDELLEAVETLRSAGFVQLSITIDRLASVDIRISLARFVEALVVHRSRAAQVAAQVRLDTSGSQQRTRQMGRHERGPSVQSQLAPVVEEHSGGLKKGLAIVYMRSFVVERFGEAAWGNLIAVFSDTERESLKRVESTKWYDLNLHAQLNREFCSRFRAGSFSIAQELGRFSAEQDFSAYRWIVPLLRPSFVVKNINRLWRKSDETGVLNVKMCDDESLLVRLSDWGIIESALCNRFFGYLCRMLEYWGPVTMFEHRSCRAFSAPTCEFYFRWHLRDIEVEFAQSLWPMDLFHFTLELRHCNSLDELAHASSRLLLSCFPCSHVRLWSALAGSGDPKLIGEAGERSEAGSMSHFVLWTGDRAVGRLDLTRSSEWSEETARMLESLLPAIATALEQLCTHH